MANLVTGVAPEQLSEDLEMVHRLSDTNARMLRGGDWNSSRSNKKSSYTSSYSYGGDFNSSRSNKKGTSYVSSYSSTGDFNSSRSNRGSSYTSSYSYGGGGADKSWSGGPDRFSHRGVEVEEEDDYLYEDRFSLRGVDFVEADSNENDEEEAESGMLGHGRGRGGGRGRGRGGGRHHGHHGHHGHRRKKRKDCKDDSEDECDFTCPVLSTQEYTITGDAKDIDEFSTLVDAACPLTFTYAVEATDAASAITFDASTPKFTIEYDADLDLASASDPWYTDYTVTLTGAGADNYSIDCDFTLRIASPCTALDSFADTA